MKIIIEPTEDNQVQFRKYKTEVTIPNDNVSISEACQALFRALIGYGYLPEDVSQYIDCEASEDYK